MKKKTQISNSGMYVVYTQGERFRGKIKDFIRKLVNSSGKILFRIENVKSMARNPDLQGMLEKRPEFLSRAVA